MFMWRIHDTTLWIAQNVQKFDLYAHIFQSCYWKWKLSALSAHACNMKQCIIASEIYLRQGVVFYVFSILFQFILLNINTLNLKYWIQYVSLRVYEIQCLRYTKYEGQIADYQSDISRIILLSFF